MKLVIVILNVLLVFSCASKKGVNSNSTAHAQTAKTMNDTTAITVNDTLPLIVEFYSIGEGINTGSKMRLDEFVTGYEKTINKSISYQAIHWGREGEIDACFRLSNLSNEQRNNFITELKKIFDDKSLVHIYENQTCRYIR